MICIVSSSHNPESRSDRLAVLALEAIRREGQQADLLRLSDHPLPPFVDQPESYMNEAYLHLHRVTKRADSLVFASPVYNWSSCAELKKYIEFVGSTPPDGSVSGGFFDKVVTVLMAGGTPHSYMASGPLMLGLLYDFKCILNPHTVYASNADWHEDGTLGPQLNQRLERSLSVHIELAGKLKDRTWRSTWSL